MVCCWISQREVGGRMGIFSSALGRVPGGLLGLAGRQTSYDTYRVCPLDRSLSAASAMLDALVPKRVGMFIWQRRRRYGASVPCCECEGKM